MAFGDDVLKIAETTRDVAGVVSKISGALTGAKPEDIKKVGTYVDFISDEANKDKVAEIDKIIGGGEPAA